MRSSLIHSLDSFSFSFALIYPNYVYPCGPRPHLLPQHMSNILTDLLNTFESLRALKFYPYIERLHSNLILVFVGAIVSILMSPTICEEVTFMSSILDVTLN